MFIANYNFGEVHMVDTNYNNKEFKDIIYTGEHIFEKEFRKCTFYHCNFSESTFENCTFDTCYFNNCNLSLTKFNHSLLNKVRFSHSKIIGVIWMEAGKLKDLTFEHSILNFSSFWGMKIKDLHINNCTAHDVDFCEADIKKAEFIRTDLHKSLFRNTILVNANFTEAKNYSSIDISSKNTTGAKFCLPEAINLLYQYNIEISEL
ncbi:MAG: pentapeptide repeat-containing protein [Barnesiella sp.]